MSSPRQAVLRRQRGVVALARARLRGSGRARAARVGAWLVVVGFAVVAVMRSLSSGADASLSGVVASAARWVAWLAGAPLALAAAEDHSALDRREGILALVAARGVSAAGLASARALAAMAEIASTLGVPLVALALLTAGLAGRVGAAVASVAVGLGAVVFAVVAGVTLGGLGALCGRVGGARGRWLLVAVVIVPWMLADLAGHGAFSIPGALGAVLDFALGSWSGSRSAGA